MKEVGNIFTDKRKFALWLHPETLDQVQALYRGDNCRSQSEFIEKAIRFYCGYLHTENAADFLPQVLVSSLEGVINLFADRLGKLLFRLAVEEAVMSHLIAADSDLDMDTLRDLRARCVGDVKRTNGQFNFADALRFQKGL